MRRSVLLFSVALFSIALVACGFNDSTSQDSTSPNSTSQGTTNPDSANPDSANPDSANPDSANPDSTDPDSTDPDSTDPDSTDPDSTNPDSTNTTASKTSTINGSAVKGPIDGAEMKLYYFDADGTETEIIAENVPVLTAASGGFEFHLDPDALDAIQTPLILRSTGGTMGGQPAPELETIISDTTALKEAGQVISRHLSTASSVAAKMLRIQVLASRSAPGAEDADTCIAKIEKVLEVDLAQDPGDATQSVAMVNLNVDANLDLFNTPENNPAVGEYIEYLARIFSTPSRDINHHSRHISHNRDDSDDHGEYCDDDDDDDDDDRSNGFDGIGEGYLARVCPNGPSRFQHLMVKVDEQSILNDGVDTATIYLKLKNGWGRRADDKVRINLAIAAGEGSLSDTTPELERGRALVTFTGSTPGQVVIQASHTLDNGNTITQEITIEVLDNSENTAPIADAGIDQNIATGSVVTLNGNQSSDLNNDPLTYSWTLVSTPSGSGAALSDMTIFNPTFTADVDGTYIAELVVNDGVVDSAPATVAITASSGNSAPTADPGQNQNVAVNSVVTLDGSSSQDPDNDALTYVWALVSAPAGSSASLADTTQVNPSFTADLEGIYEIQLVVNDGTVDSSPATVTITASAGNSAPTANAGPNQNVTTGSIVTLDGGGSSDADNDPLAYTWTMVSTSAGSSATLSNATQVNPSFTADMDGTYVIELVVNDGAADSTPATVTITASTANSAPTADAGANQNVPAGTVVSLDGAGSSDADNDPLTYAWTLVSKPSGSSVTLPAPADSEQVFITPDVAGDYVVQLVVNDGQVNSAPDTVTITATAAGPDGAALFSANCAACHGADGSQIVDLRGTSGTSIANTMPHKGITLNDIDGTAGAQAIADFLMP